MLSKRNEKLVLVLIVVSFVIAMVLITLFLKTYYDTELLKLQNVVAPKATLYQN